jgi:hypothetical protein
MQIHNIVKVVVIGLSFLVYFEGTNGLCVCYLRLLYFHLVHTLKVYEVYWFLQNE